MKNSRLRHKAGSLHPPAGPLHTRTSSLHAQPVRGIVRWDGFELDPVGRRLTQAGALIYLPERQFDVLAYLTARPGEIIPKDTIIEHAWRGAAVTDNNLSQAVKRLRLTLGKQPNGTDYIVNHVRKGYQFIANVEVGPMNGMGLPVAAVSKPVADIDGLLEPYRAFVDGLAALETLDRNVLDGAAAALDYALEHDPNLTAAHIGLATIDVLRFEATRADAAPDRDALVRAEAHARHACQLNPSSAHAWSTLALVLHRKREPREALAAAQKAVEFEPDEWQHHLRLAFVSGGGKRLRAANRILALCPGLGLADWLAATVYVAREAFDRALEHLREGCAAQDAQLTAGTGGSRFTAVGLHHLHGLVLAARGDIDGARAELQKELTSSGSGHIYRREAAAHTWYSLGAIALRQRQIDEAALAFEQALTLVPDLAVASLGFSASRKVKLKSEELKGLDHADPISVAIARAVACALQDRHADAAQVIGEALVSDIDPHAGWMLPVEPLLNVAAHRDAWASTLDVLHQRFR